MSTSSQKETPTANALRAGGDQVSIGLVTDFNGHNLAALLRRDTRAFGRVDCVQAPFGQTAAVMLNHDADFWRTRHDAVVVWTVPERAVPSFGKVLSFEAHALDDLLEEVDAFGGLIEGIPEWVKTIFVPTWTAPGMERGWGPLDLAQDVGVASALMRMNIRLADRFKNNRRVVLLDAQRWLSSGGPEAYSPKLWYLSKTPYRSTVFQEASQDILAALEGIRGRSRKIVILDLDDTLWGGTLGDEGWEQLRLGGHDPVGEAFTDFQKALKRLVNRGVVLALVSKNEESVALEAIRRHPEMVLKTDDFAAWRINWSDKAQNIVDLLAGLRLGPEAAVFIDNSPFERNRVSEALPQIFVPEMPADPAQYSVFLSRLRCFDNPTLTREDRTRTMMYVADRGRVELKTKVKSLSEWLDLLDLKVSVERLNTRNLERAAQLMNKTNQMNLTTRRLPASELYKWAERVEHALWTFRVSDRFGDYGLCGLASLVQKGTSGQILDFVLSCRVMGRGVEEAMVSTAIRHARDLGCDEVWAEYVPSVKNQPCRKLFESLPFTSNENRFVFPTRNLFPVPRHIDIDRQVLHGIHSDPAYQ